MNWILSQWRSLNTRVTLYTLGIFVVGIWAVAFFASRMLREDMQSVLGEQQFSTVSLLAAQVDQELGDRSQILEAERLKNCVRAMDTVARFGGDEFVVMLSELDEDRAESITQAGIVAEKIRIALAEPYLLTIRHEGKADILVEHRCTASIGVALFLDHEASQDDFLKWADRAMYQAKEARRDSIRFYDSKA